MLVEALLRIRKADAENEGTPPLKTLIRTHKKGAFRPPSISRFLVE